MPTLRFNLKQLLVATAFCAVCFAFWHGFLRNAVEICPPEHLGDPELRYFGIDSDSPYVHPIAVAIGRFKKGTRMIVTLMSVENGSIQELETLSVGRSPNQLGTAFWNRMRINLAIGSVDAKDGRAFSIGSHGQSRANGKRIGRVATFPINHTQSFPVTLTPRTEHIIFAAGSHDVNHRRETTLQEFANANEGSYLIVLARLE